MSQLILPPGGLILLAVLGLIFWRKIWGRGLVALALLMFWLLSTEPVRDMLTAPLEMQYPALNIQGIHTQDAAIVVLGGGIQENSLDYQGSDELSRSAMMRAIYAAKIAQQTPFKLYTTGGTPLTQDAEAEGDIMKRWLIWFGIDGARIHAENKANTTWENATLTQAFLKKEGIN
ncbi:MAG: ElyC/SanA/YdcF family protein, partial [Ghiorsea sp.]